MSGGRDAKYFGVAACEAIAEARPETVQRAFFSESVAKRFGPLMKQLAERRRPYRVVDAAELEKVAGARHHEGVVLITSAPDARAVKDVVAAFDGARPARWLCIDGVRNPHNVGALLRTAAHFGGAAMIGLLALVFLREPNRNKS